MCDLYALHSGDGYKTEVWIEEDALNELWEWSERAGVSGSRYLKTLERCAKNGFWNFEGRDGQVRWKSDFGVYAFQAHATLFRVYGNYEPPTKTGFLGLTSTLKPGQKMSDGNKKAARLAATRFKSGEWTKR